MWKTRCLKKRICSCAIRCVRKVGVEGGGANALFLKYSDEPFSEAPGKSWHTLPCTDRDGFFLLPSAFCVSELREGEETYVRLI